MFHVICFPDKNKTISISCISIHRVRRNVVTLCSDSVKPIAQTCKMKSSEIDIPEVNVGGFLPSIKSTECIKPHESMDNIDTQQGTNNWRNSARIYQINLNYTTLRNPISVAYFWYIYSLQY